MSLSRSGPSKIAGNFVEYCGLTLERRRLGNMYQYAVFLRGINVGGVKILMKDLISLFEQAGFSPVRTLLASGNVVLGSEHEHASMIKVICEQHLAQSYNRELKVIVQDLGQLESVVSGYPFVASPDGVQRHEYVVLTDSVADAAAILATAPEALDSERLMQLGAHICWEVPRGESLSSPLAKHFAKVSKKYLVTTRNMNTMAKVLNIMRELA